MSNKPKAKLRIGAVTATIWENENSEGKKFYSVNLIRSYRDNDGEWQEADNLNHGDLMNAARVLERAEEWITGQ